MSEFFSDHWKPEDIRTWLNAQHEHYLIGRQSNVPVEVLHLVRELYNNLDEYTELSNPKESFVNHQSKMIERFYLKIVEYFIQIW